MALHERPAEAALELAEAALHRRLVDAERAAGGERAAVARDGEQVLEVVPVEGLELCAIAAPFCNLAPSAAPRAVPSLRPFDLLLADPEHAMTPSPFLLPRPCLRLALVTALLLGCGLAACGGNDDDERVVRVTSSSPNIVSYWNDVANRTVNATATVNVTAEEQRPSYHVDLATVHVAIYDAVNAIDGRFLPFAVDARRARGRRLDRRRRQRRRLRRAERALSQSRRAIPGRLRQRRSPRSPTARRRRSGSPLAARSLPRSSRCAPTTAAPSRSRPTCRAARPASSAAPIPTPFNRYVPFIKPFSLTRVDQFRPGRAAGAGERRLHGVVQREQGGRRHGRARRARRSSSRRRSSTPRRPRSS